MSAIRRRFIGNGNSSKNRDRNPPDDESSTTNENVTIQNEIVSPDDILARYSNKTSTSVENPPKTSDESTEPIGVSSKIAEKSFEFSIYSGRYARRYASVL